jgi:hypothetical protein
VCDLVPAVDHLTTGEALELILTFAARVAFHGSVSGSSSLKSKFTGSGFGGVHFLVLFYFF